jgi:hypothetical protein
MTTDFSIEAQGLAPALRTVETRFERDAGVFNAFRFLTSRSGAKSTYTFLHPVTLLPWLPTT